MASLRPSKFGHFTSLRPDNADIVAPLRLSTRTQNNSRGRYGGRVLHFDGMKQ